MRTSGNIHILFIDREFYDEILELILNGEILSTRGSGGRRRE